MILIYVTIYIMRNVNNDCNVYVMVIVILISGL